MKPILVDSCIWIDYLRGKDAKLSTFISQLLDANEAAINGIILAEVLMGAKGDAEYQKLAAFMRGLVYEDDDQSIAMEAARLGVKARQAGIQVPLSDLIIAGQCTTKGYRVLTRDGHFKQLEEGLGVALMHERISGF